MNDELKATNEFLRSKSFRRIVYGIGAVLVVLIIFQAGEYVGYRKAGFSYHLGDTYYRAFEGPGMMRGTPPFFEHEFPAAHGAAGKVLSVNLPTFVLDGSDGVEKVVVISDDTVVRHFRDDTASTSITAGDFVIVLGDPNEASQIEAKLIRVIPPPQQSGSAQ